MLSQIRCMLLRSSATTVRTFQNTVINLTKTVFGCRQVQFEALRRIVANASWVRKYAECAGVCVACDMCDTDEGACTVLYSSSSPLPAMMWPIEPMKNYP